MSELISRQRLIEAVEKEYHRFIDDDRDVAHNRAIYDVLEIIKAQPPVESPVGIDKQKLIEELEKVFKKFHYVWGEDGLLGKAVYDTIMNIPPADQWIPCSEGTLPANRRTVPVTNEVSQKKRYMTTATYYTKKGVVDDYEWTGEGFYQYDSEYGYGRLHNVIAWLNVEPYKGE